ncbi:MAG: GNAT family N-acetyltransferase [Butyrivibrio sp.]|nr:GNAT family N-acetyltransferase [Butyrivibrio sp.]
MLKRIIFSLTNEIYSSHSLRGPFDRTARYIRQQGYESDVKKAGDSSFDLYNKEKKESSLIVTDSAEDAERLTQSGFYCVGVLHDKNPDEKFKGLKFVFSDIEEVECDSFVKAYQRYAGEPWKVMRTERLLIRETTIEDVDEFYRIYKDPEMTRYMEGLFEDPEDEKRYQKDYISKVYGFLGFGVWTLVRLSDNTVIGRAGYSVRNGFDDIELGFLIGKEYQNQGFAYEACRAILNYGRDVLAFEHVQTLVKKENLVSINLCKKLGFEEDGEVEVEEDIYGHGYNGSDRVSLSQAKYGKYIRFRLTF